MKRIGPELIVNVNPDDVNVLKNTIIILISCFMNASYNNIIEYSVKKYRIPNIDFQIIFQITYFAMIIIAAIYYTIHNLPPVDAQTIFLYFLIALGLQMYMFNKIFRSYSIIKFNISWIR